MVVAGATTEAVGSTKLFCALLVCELGQMGMNAATAAFSGTHTPGKLPPIRYLSGGLESEEMRKHVCDILEGRELAFKERARRLRVRLDR